MKLLGYAIARPWDEARYGMVLAYLTDDGRWIRGGGAADTGGHWCPPEAKLWRDDDWCLAPEEKGTKRYGRMRVDVELDQIRSQWPRAYRFAVLAEERTAAPAARGPVKF